MNSGAGGQSLFANDGFGGGGAGGIYAGGGGGYSGAGGFYAGGGRSFLHLVVVNRFLQSGGDPEGIEAVHGAVEITLIVDNECRADFDNDSFITGVDFDLYVAAFEAGC